MSLIIRYKFDQPTGSLHLDSSGNNFHLVSNSNVVSAYSSGANVASFAGTVDSRFLSQNTTPTEMNGSNPRTISFWYNRFSSPESLFEYGSSTDANRVRIIVNNLQYVVYTNQNNNAAVSPEANRWYHIALTYSTGTFTLYQNSAQINQWTSTADVPSGTLIIGGASGTTSFEGYMSDFRVYDDALSASEVYDIAVAGRNPPPLTVSMFTHIADLTWESVGGASEYILTSKQDGASEVTLTTTSSLSFTVYNLIQGSSYEFNLYTDLDLVTPIDTKTESPSSVNTVNVDSLLTRLGNDLTLLNSTSIDEVEGFLPSSLTTGETLNTSLGVATFVANSETLLLPNPNYRILTPFLAGSGSGQAISITLPNSSTAVITYNEATDKITFDSTVYSADQYFAVGGLKALVKEF